MSIPCPKCGGTTFKAIEQVQATYTVEFVREGNHLMIEQDPFGEFEKNDGASVTLMYMCANDMCPFTVHPTKLESTFQ